MARASHIWYGTNATPRAGDTRNEITRSEMDNSVAKTSATLDASNACLLKNKCAHMSAAVTLSASDDSQTNWFVLERRPATNQVAVESITKL